METKGLELGCERNLIRWVYDDKSSTKGIMSAWGW